MPHGSGGRAVVFVAILMVPSGVTAQRLEITPRLGMGLGSGWMTAETGIRLEVSGSRWGGYGRVGVQAFTQTCATSLPPYCNLPRGSAREVAAGVTRLLDVSSTWTAYVGAGVGVLDWDGRDWFADAEGAFRRPLGQRVALSLGLHAFVTSSLERPRNGDMPIVRDRRIIVLNPFVGLGLRLGPR